MVTSMKRTLPVSGGYLKVSLNLLTEYLLEKVIFELKCTGQIQRMH